MDEGAGILADEPPGNSSATGLPLWANLIIALVVVCFSALFSGLTLGLMSLDKYGLEILMKGGDETERKQASVIYPLRKRGNLLLCTLLIGNTVVNSFLSILLADVTTGLLGLVVSTSLIVIFGEIMPQSLCSRHPLVIGANTRYVTWFFVILFFPVSFPISKVLDLVLGREVGQIYDRDMLKELIRIHVEDPDAQQECGLTADDGAILHGALGYRDKKVSDVMTPLERVFMLEASLCLDYEIMLQIYKSGYTRIPVYDGVRNHIIGLLYTKDLILIDPADRVELRNLIALRGTSNVKFILDSTPLGECFRTFKGSYIHMLVAVSLSRSGSSTSNQHSVSNALLQTERCVSGVITLEDVLEEVIQAEIVDESDIYMNNDMQTRIQANRHNVDVTCFLGLIHNRYRTVCPKLSDAEASAVESFLIARVKEFSPFAEHRETLHKLVSEAEVTANINSNVHELLAVETDRKHQPHPDPKTRGVSTRSIVSPHPEEAGFRSGKVLYRMGEPADFFLVVLQGKIIVRAGQEEFESVLGPWCTLGARALVEDYYVPDYTAVGVENLVVIKISKRNYQSILHVIQHRSSVWDDPDDHDSATGDESLEEKTSLISHGGLATLLNSNDRNRRRESQVSHASSDLDTAAASAVRIPVARSPSDISRQGADIEMVSDLREDTIRDYNESMVKRTFSSSVELSPEPSPFLSWKNRA
mmetsp:Transcript_31402/g.89121  ORF Transcript_31402/g.89121 Transcript_31402/m.89121 type:complete len:704 (-) Transcript_31402:21-2132(-)